jgi:ATP-binding cassette subfamily C (CFTR/MRP) protein 10
MKAVGRFEQECLDKVEANQKAQYASVAASQWLELRLQLIGVAVVISVAFIAVVQHDSRNIDPG